MSNYCLLGTVIFMTTTQDVPRAVVRNTHIMTKSFICKGPELWGELSQNTKESKSLSSFKKQIKNIHINKLNMVLFMILP